MDTDQAAPYYFEVADGPERAQAFWIQTKDQKRLRVGFWPADAPRGTIFISPGRSEYIEKYSRFAKFLIERQYYVTSIDWRGQGLSDRLAPDPMIGHVHHFADYQNDLEVWQMAAQEYGCPKPWFHLAHSMGECIILRSLHRNSSMTATAFSGPMWDIKMHRVVRKCAKPMMHMASFLGLGKRLAPTTSRECYNATGTFEGNTLTPDREMWLYMQKQVQDHQDLQLGGPSVHWLAAALSEMDALMRLPAPDMPTLCVMGGNERIVGKKAIRKRMKNWKNSELHIIDGAEHEVLMLDRGVQNMLADQITSFFEKYA